MEHTFWSSFLKSVPPPWAASPQTLFLSSMQHWSGISARADKRCPKASASKGKHHPHLMPWHWGPTWLPQRPLPVISGQQLVFRLWLFLRTQGFRSSSKCTFYGLVMSPVRVSSCPPPAKHSLGQVLLSCSLSSRGFPKLPWGQPKVFLHSFSEIILHLGFCICDHHSCSPLGLSVSFC